MLTNMAQMGFSIAPEEIVVRFNFEAAGRQPEAGLQVSHLFARSTPAQQVSFLPGAMPSINAATWFASCLWFMLDLKKPVPFEGSLFGFVTRTHMAMKS